MYLEILLLLMIVCFDVQDEQHFFLSFFFLSNSCDLNYSPTLLTRTFASGLKSVMPPIFKAPLVFTFLFGSSSFLFYLCSIISTCISDSEFPISVLTFSKYAEYLIDSSTRFRTRAKMLASHIHRISIITVYKNHAFCLPFSFIERDLSIGQIAFISGDQYRCLLWEISLQFLDPDVHFRP